MMPDSHHLLSASGVSPLYFMFANDVIPVTVLGGEASGPNDHRSTNMFKAMAEGAPLS